MCTEAQIKEAKNAYEAHFLLPAHLINPYSGETLIKIIFGPGDLGTDGVQKLDKAMLYVCLEILEGGQIGQMKPFKTV